MTRYVAFLRAINVGGHTVKMDHLRALFVQMRFANVETFIASGNVLFDTASKSAAAMESRMEKHLQEMLGYEVPTFLRPIDGLQGVVANHPFDSFERDGHALSVGFMKSAAGPSARQKLMALQAGYDEFHLHDRELYWLCRGRMSDSALGGGTLDKALGAPVTFRNVSTVRKLAAKASARR